MLIFELFTKSRTCWVEFETVYTLDRMDSICLRLTEKQIHHKVRAALLPAGTGLVFPASTRSLWYLSVHEEDVSRTQRCVRAVTEEMA